MRQYLTKAVGENVKERWQGRLLWARWEDDLLGEQGRFVWLSGWACAPTPAIAGGYGTLRAALTTSYFWSTPKRGQEED